MARNIPVPPLPKRKHSSGGLALLAWLYALVLVGVAVSIQRLSDAGRLATDWSRRTDQTFNSFLIRIWLNSKNKFINWCNYSSGELCINF